MNQKNTFLAKNTIFGIFVGITFIFASLLFYKTGRNIAFNPQLSNIFLLLSIAGAYIGTHKYRVESLEGYISFARALGSAVYIIAVGAFVHSIYLFNLFSISTELQDSYKSMIDLALDETYKGEEFLNTMKMIMANTVSPIFVAITDFFNKIFTGFLFSLIIAVMVRRKKW